MGSHSAHHAAQRQKPLPGRSHTAAAPTSITARCPDAARCGQGLTLTAETPRCLATQGQLTGPSGSIERRGHQALPLLSCGPSTARLPVTTARLTAATLPGWFPSGVGLPPSRGPDLRLPGEARTAQHPLCPPSPSSAHPASHQPRRARPLLSDLKSRLRGAAGSRLAEAGPRGRRRGPPRPPELGRHGARGRARKAALVSSARCTRSKAET